MKAGPAGGAPLRAGARQAAPYGLRWRARDLARLGWYRVARAHYAVVIANWWIAVGCIVLVVNGALARPAPASAPGYIVGALQVVTGVTVAEVARRRRWHR